MKHAEGYAVAVFVGYVVIFFAIAIMPTGGDPPWFFDRFARYEIGLFSRLVSFYGKENVNRMTASNYSLLGSENH